MAEVHVDNAVLETLRDVMEDEYSLLLETFLADSEERLRLLVAAAQSADAQAMRLAAHSFKGSCSNMGALLLASLCKELEELARRELLDQVAPVLEQVQREFAIVRILFKAELQRYR
ncbi:MAG: Hpt domain-containing protein [Pseudomonadaceae bacterium]|nr:Hpt domain-containing protein [Pseudomonadaceae bacterium]